MQLTHLERVREPVFDLVWSHRGGDLLAPPQSGLAGVAVAESHQLAVVEGAKGAEAAAPGMPPGDGCLVTHAAVAVGITKSRREDDRELVQQRFAYLAGRKRAQQILFRHAVILRRSRLAAEAVRSVLL